MFKRKMVLTLVMVMAVLLSLQAIVPVNATTVTKSDKDIEFFSDGSYTVIEITEETPLFALFSTTSTKTSSKSSTHYDSYGVALWKATVIGTFTYNGVTASCTSASHSATIYDRSYSVKSQSSTKSGNKASAITVIQKRVLGIVTATISHTTTLSCDKNGNLS